MTAEHTSSTKHENYDSEFDSDHEEIRRRREEVNLIKLPASAATAATSKADNKANYRQECAVDEGRRQRLLTLRLNAYDRHKKLINDYLLYHPGATHLLQRDTSTDQTDQDVLRKNHRFLWDEQDADSWEKRLAKKYYDKLFKEYCICDLSRYKDNKIALRWRTQDEVEKGRGQFTCANKKCAYSANLRSWEVNFAYVEAGEKKNALVKVRLCPECSCKLNYRHQRREVTKIKRKRKHKPAQDVPEKLTKTDESAESDKAEDKPDELWGAAPTEKEEDKSLEEEFEEYLEDLLL